MTNLLLVFGLSCIDISTSTFAFELLLCSHHYLITMFNIVLFGLFKSNFPVPLVFLGIKNNELFLVLGSVDLCLFGNYFAVVFAIFLLCAVGMFPFNEALSRSI